MTSKQELELSLLLTDLSHLRDRMWSMGTRSGLALIQQEQKELQEQINYVLQALKKEEQA